ncbi:unnamed protein product [Arctogadus glacialis]
MSCCVVDQEHAEALTRWSPTRPPPQQKGNPRGPAVLPVFIKGGSISSAGGNSFHPSFINLLCLVQTSVVSS